MNYLFYYISPPYFLLAFHLGTYPTSFYLVLFDLLLYFWEIADHYLLPLYPLRLFLCSQILTSKNLLKFTNFPWNMWTLREMVKNFLWNSLQIRMQIKGLCNTTFSKFRSLDLITFCSFKRVS